MCSLLFNIFSDKDLHAFILEGRKENKMGTCDLDDKKSKCKFCKKEGHYTVFFLKNSLKRKGFMDIINLRKADRIIRDANDIEIVMEA
jgi:hypothetical protein